MGLVVEVGLYWRGQGTGIAVDFAGLVRDALGKLYDPVAMQTHPLGRLVPAARVAMGASAATEAKADIQNGEARGRKQEQAGRALRQWVLDGMGQLRPATKGSETTPAWRAYRLLELRYVSAMDPPAVREQLGISKAEYYREHRRALDALVSLLAAQAGTGTSDDAGGGGRAAGRGRGGVPDQAGGTGPDGVGNVPVVSVVGAATGGTRADGTPPNNLPLQLTSFVGRERELVAVQEAVGRTRLVTLTGVGGTGKTRLALQVAAEALPRYPDGVWLVDLAPLAEERLVTYATLAALGLREAPGVPVTDQLVEHLRGRALLLVLDNCEHLLDACARLVDAVLRTCPRVHILATSREALGLSGETIWQVPPLAVPTVPPIGDPGAIAGAPEALLESDAVQLFVDRARLVQPAFAVTSQNATAVAMVCRALDGIPLAIELAAARVRALDVEQLAARLDESFGPGGGRFRLLTGGSRTALSRQQTLRATVEWSYELLSDDERALLSRLAVFEGGWTLEAAEIVCSGSGTAADDVFDLLSRLVDKSLVIAEPGLDRNVRYRLLETLREFARERLAERGETEAFQQRHAAYFLSLAEEAEAASEGPNQAEWFERCAAEHDNFRAALRWWSGAQDPNGSLRLAVALSWFWDIRGHWSEARGWLAAGTQKAAGDRASSADPVMVAWAKWWAADFARRLADNEQAWHSYEEAQRDFAALGVLSGVAAALWGLGYRQNFGRRRELWEQSLATARETGDQRAVSRAMHWLGHWMDENGDDPTAVAAQFEAVLAIEQERGNLRGIADLLDDVGMCARQVGDLKRAGELHERSLALRRQLKDPWGAAISLRRQGQLAMAAGDAAAAKRLAQESAAELDRLGNRSSANHSHMDVGIAAQRLGEHAEAEHVFWHCLRFSVDTGQNQMIGPLLALLAETAISRGENERGLRLAGASTAACGATQQRLAVEQRPTFDRAVEAAREMLGISAADGAWAAGTSMPQEQAVHYALGEGTWEEGGVRR